MGAQANLPQRLALLIASCLATPFGAGAAPWSLVNPTAQGPAQGASSLQWSRVEPSRPDPGAPRFSEAPATGEVSATALNWTPLSDEERQRQELAIQQELDTANQERQQPRVLLPPSGPTYANFRALWRDGDWLPQISNTVPTGFGPQGVMATFEFRGIDCITGTGLCTVPANLEAYRQQIEKQGEAFYDFSVGFGDSSKNVGVILTAVIEGTEVPLGNRQQSSNGLFADKNLGIHLARHLSPDTAVRIGVENLFREVCDDGACGLPQNAYGVISQRLRLQTNQNTWFPNAYLTLGAGNGAYRPLSEQVQASIAAQRAAGCSTYGYAPKQDCSSTTRRRAVYDAASFGDLSPIGSVGLEVFNGFHLISEWSGRNLNAGLSFRPFPELGLVITPMWENLLPNCDYGCRVSVPNYAPGAPIPENLLTERARFSIQASIEVKF